MSTYSPNLRIELIDSGTQAGVWGSTTNTNLGTLIEQSISGYVTVSITAASQALTFLNGATDQSRMAMVNLTTTTVAAFSVFVPPSPKQYTFKNSSAYTATIYCSTILGNTTAGGTSIVVPTGAIISVWSDGANISLQNQNSVTPTAGTNNTQVATTAFVQAAVQALYPVGRIYISTVATNPAAPFGFGAWSAYGGGKVLVGFLASDPLFGTGGQLQGSANTPVITHTHSSTVSISGGQHYHGTSDPGHVHGAGGNATNIRVVGGNNLIASGGNTAMAYTGISILDATPFMTGTMTNPAPNGTVSAGTNTNYQPSITVYMWKRDS